MVYLSLWLFSLPLPYFVMFFSHISDSWNGSGAATSLGLAHAVPASHLANSYLWLMVKGCLIKQLYSNKDILKKEGCLLLQEALPDLPSL